MKRISFFLVILCALILSVGLSSVQAQSGITDLRNVTGLYSKDTLFSGQNVRFVLGFNNNTSGVVNNSNGWQVSSPDGAIFDSIRIDTCGPFVSGKSKLKQYFDLTCKYLNFKTDPANGPDTVGFLGATGDPTVGGMPVGFNDSVMAVNVYMQASTLTTNNLKHLCIDSAFFQPGGTWTWVDANTLAAYTPTWVDNMAGAPTYGPGGFCFVLYQVPHIAPVIVNTGVPCTPYPPAAFVDPTLSGSHCGAFTYDFDACQKDNAAITFHLASLDGTIDPVTGVWSASGLSVGPHTVSVYATDATPSTGATVNMTVNVTNAAPTIAGDCGNTITTSTGTNTNAQFTSTDADNCDPKNWSIVSVLPAGPTVSIDGTGKVTFNSAAAGDYVVTVGVSDGIVTTPTECSVTFHVLAGSLYGVIIAKNEKVLQGGFSGVDVTLKGYDPALGLGGFDLLISYDNSALSLQNVTTGKLYADCKWEYFTFRFGANGNCSGGCPSGLVRIVGLAETNNGALHPACFAPPTVPEQMFTLNFLVSNNRTFACQYVPIRFFWVDCSDNTLSSQDGSWLIIAKNVYDFHNQLQPISDSFATFPGYAGVPIGACGDTVTNLPPGKHAPKRDIDFFDGGIDIVCAESIDARGDINLNNVPNEVADVVMFTNYFINGLSAFGSHSAGSIAASDVNNDGNALTVADLVYLIRVLVGDALPYPKTSPSAVTAGYSNNLGSLSVDQPMAAAFVVAKGNVTPTLLASGMRMEYAFDGKNTRILVYPPYDQGNNIKTFSGNFLNAGGDVVSVDLSTAQGAQVVAKVIPANFGLAQNYPNPFNPSTTISFDLPKASQYSLTIYNVTGQSVAEFSGSAEAGTQKVVWNASSNASGIYFYKLSAGSYSATKKMVLLK